MRIEVGEDLLAHERAKLAGYGNGWSCDLFEEG